MATLSLSDINRLVLLARLAKILINYNIPTVASVRTDLSFETARSTPKSLYNAVDVTTSQFYSNSDIYYPSLLFFPLRNLIIPFQPSFFANNPVSLLQQPFQTNKARVFVIRRIPCPLFSSGDAEQRMTPLPSYLTSSTATPTSNIDRSTYSAWFLILFGRPDVNTTAKSMFPKLKLFHSSLFLTALTLWYECDSCEMSSTPYSDGSPPCCGSTAWMFQLSGSPPRRINRLLTLVWIAVVLRINRACLILVWIAAMCGSTTNIRFWTFLWLDTLASCSNRPTTTYLNLREPECSMYALGPSRAPTSPRTLLPHSATWILQHRPT
jgi:hypothetical protein